MDYNSIISSLRELARDTLRLLKVNEIRADRLSVASRLEKGTKDHETLLADLAHRTAVANFRIAKVDDADPDKDTKLKQWSEDIALYNENSTTEVEEFAKFSENLTKELSDLDAKIAKVQSGEYKVCAEALSAETERLIQAITEEAAAGIPLNTAEKTS